MRKSRIFIFLSVFLVLVLLATGLFACKKDPVVDPAEGRVVAVASAMDTIYSAMVASDGSLQTNYFTLKSTGSYSSGEDVYDVDFAGTFDITQSNGASAADNRSQMLFEVKRGGIEVFLLYYKEGSLYVDFPPYARRGVISDYRIDETVRRLMGEKNNGTVKTVADMMPQIASRIFTDCHCFTEEDGSERYVFTLSYERLFEAFAPIVDSWDAGFTSEELLAALHLTEDSYASIIENAGKTTVQFVVKDNAFLSAKGSEEGKGSLSLESFTLTRGLDEIALPSALSTFTEFDYRNISLSGTMYLRANDRGDRTTNYDVTVNRAYADVTYPFRYDLKTHYVAGQGLEFSLTLTDKNDKRSAFDIRGEYLYLDLTAYGVDKCKIKTSDLSERLGTMGFKEVGEYDFRDRLHLLVLLAAGRSEEGDVVKYTLGRDFFDLISEKIGFKGLFGVDGAEISWDKANNRLQNLSASVTVGGMAGSLSAASFTFGSPVTLSAITDADYADLTTKETTHFAFSGTMRQNTVLGSEGAVLSSLIASLAGTTPSVEPALNFDVSGSIAYTADLVFGRTGAVSSFFIRMYSNLGKEIVNFYYTDETPEVFYLIYPGTDARAVRTFPIAEDALAAFNSALSVSSAGMQRKLYLGAKENEFMFGMQSSMLGVIAEKIGLIYPDFSLNYLSQLRCRRYEVRVTDQTITAKVIFDEAEENDFQITAESFRVSYGDNGKIASLTATTPVLVPLLADNDTVTGMPEDATVTFPGGLSYKVSLLDPVSGEKAWSYANTPKNVGRAGQIENVEATISVLGKTLTKTIRVDMTPPSEVRISAGTTYSGRYDAATRTFTMTYYNDVTPKTLFDTFPSLVAVVNGVAYPKDVEWDISRVAALFGVRDVRVDPKVKTFFGDTILLGEDFQCKLHVEGKAAFATDYSIRFVAYDGRDPMNDAVYSDVLVVKTGSEDDPEILEVRHVEWDLANSFIAGKMEDGTLYAYSTQPDDPAQPETPQIVHARVFDSSGAYKVLNVNVYFDKRVVRTTTFDVTSLDGVTYSEEKGFVFDVLKIQGISSTKTDGVLPQNFIANAGEEDEWVPSSGIKWSFDPIEGVLNASGKTGTLSMTIGDSISGYQEKTFNYTFTAITVTDTALLDEEDQPIASIAKVNASFYDYAATNLNAYTYRFPKYVLVTYMSETGAAVEKLVVDWKYDRPFDEDALCDGGSYVLTGAVGSEPLTVTLGFDREIITSYRFADPGSLVATLTTHQGKECLTFSALSALAENGVKYSVVANYPATLEVAFNGGSDYVPVPVTWDLSAYDDREDMLGSGFFGTVTAVATGQFIEVYVFVEQAFDTVYTDEALTKTDLTFSLMSAGRLLSDGVHHELVVTDPRDTAKSYPSVLYIGVDQTISVIEWLGVDAVARLYSENYETTAPNMISGNVIVRAKIGDPDVGYKEISIPVSIVDSEIDQSDISVSGLPFAASSEMTGGTTVYAITPKHTALTVDGQECSLVLELNPYYVDPTAQRTYPAYLDFTVDGVAVRAEAKWDLSRIPAGAAEVDQTAEYLVWAMVDLGPSFKKVKIPVAVSVLKREIDVVWIKDSAGNDSGEKYIDIDGYSATPFGGDIVGDWVYLDVKVQFKKDANRYPLKLKYNKKDVLLYYDGSVIYQGDDVEVFVGNESGGYREVKGYTIRILSNIISKVVTNGNRFFEATSDPVTGRITYLTPDAEAVDIAELPDTISVTFGYGAESKVISDVPVATENNAGKGLVFSWVRSPDEHHYLGIELWNPALTETVGAGMRQAVYNSEQKEYASPKANMFFTDIGEHAFTSEVTYRDEEDGGKITVGAFLADREDEIFVDKIEKAYQVRYITADEDNAPRMNYTDELGAGTYRLYVSVEGHEQYAGSVYHTFTVNRKDLSDYIVLSVNGGLRFSTEINPIPKEQYTGNAFIVRAKVDPNRYSVDAPLLVNGASSQQVTDVCYSGKTVTAYVFTVTADENDEIGRNYYVSGTVSFLITESTCSAEVTFTWLPSMSKFDVEVTVLGRSKTLSYSDSGEENLTNGYKITYYEKDGSGDFTPVAVLESGHTYYYRLVYKIPNYAKTTILPNDENAIHS